MGDLNISQNSPYWQDLLCSPTTQAPLKKRNKKAHSPPYNGDCPMRCQYRRLQFGSVRIGSAVFSYGSAVGQSPIIGIDGILLWDRGGVKTFFTLKGEGTIMKTMV